MPAIEQKKHIKRPPAVRGNGLFICFFARSLSVNKRKGGFTILEVLVVLAIGIIITALGFSAFVSTLTYQSVEKDADVGLSYIQKARTLTINSSNNTNYGVKFATTTITIFPGTAYSSSSQNIVYNLNTRVNISSVSLSSGATEFYFNKITGDASATGTVTFSLISGASSSSKQILIYGTGLAQLN